MELRQNTQQIIRVGVLIALRRSWTTAYQPITNANLSWYRWHYLIKPDGTVVDIVNYPWINVPNCAGCYYLTLSAEDTNQLGQLTLYIFDNNFNALSLENPIFETFNIVNQNEYDSKNLTLLQVEQLATTG